MLNENFKQMGLTDKDSTKGCKFTGLSGQSEDTFGSNDSLVCQLPITFQDLNDAERSHSLPAYDYSTLWPY